MSAPRFIDLYIYLMSSFDFRIWTITRMSLGLLVILEPSHRRLWVSEGPAAASWKPTAVPMPTWSLGSIPSNSHSVTFFSTTLFSSILCVSISWFLLFTMSSLFRCYSANKILSRTFVSFMSSFLDLVLDSYVVTRFQEAQLRREKNIGWVFRTVERSRRVKLGSLDKRYF